MLTESHKQLVIKLNNQSKHLNNDQIVEDILDKLGGYENLEKLAESWFWHHKDLPLEIQFATALTAGYKLALIKKQ